ncbi:MAG: hypothetical protein C5B53_03610, partial [Candidatus Melainabacteria bacterium]
MNNIEKIGTIIKCFALALGLFVSIMPARASDAAPRFLRIPVLFITDRNLAPPKKHPDAVDFGPHRKYIGECKHDPYMGTAYCVMPNVEGKQLDKHLTDLGWAAAQGKEKEGDFKATL